MMAEEEAKLVVSADGQEQEEEEDELEPVDPSQLFRSAVKVVYCGVCSMPSEYCEFNAPKTFAQCRAWLKTRDPEAYVSLGFKAKDEEELKAKSQARKVSRLEPPPKERFQPWTHIYAFHNISAIYLKREKETPKSPENVLVVRGKIKLHGTNAAVNTHFEARKKKIETFAQSRNRFILKEHENYGFSGFVKKTSDYFGSLLSAVRAATSVEEGASQTVIQTLTVFGEWCGQGINKGASVCNLDRKVFAVFSVQLDNDWIIYDPESLENFFNLSSSPRPKDMFILPYSTPEVCLDFGNSDSLTDRIEEMNTIVESIDREDPWIKATFGVTGAGEGLVWYPILDDQRIQTLSSSSSSSWEACLRSKGFAGKIAPLSALKLLFKTKGPTHSVVQQKRCVQLTPEVATTVEQFAEMFITKPRLEQCFQETRGMGQTESAGSKSHHRRGKGKAASKKPTVESELGEDISEVTVLAQQLPHFIRWIVNDVKREGEEELLASGLAWEDAAIAVEVMARRWFQAEVLNRCGVALPEDPLRNNE